jgi:hypothetical protein
MPAGIGLLGAITATITSYLPSRDSHHGPDHSLARELDRLAALGESGVLMRLRSTPWRKTTS